VNSIIRPGIDNSIYDDLSDGWWSDETFAGLLKHVTNPWRVSYFKRTLMQGLKIDPKGKGALDVGCGGGILAEELATMGFDVTGVDPSGESLEVARAHAAQKGLKIDYRVGHGDELPFENETFEVVFCCDVLEHIHNWDKAIGEIARVLKGGGVFFYDTVNRTPFSKITVIKLAQEWKFTRFLPPNLHAWEMFIKPEELKASFERHGLEHKEIKGTRRANAFQIFMAMRQYKTGKISPAEFGQRTRAQEGPNTDGFYMGHAIKPSCPNPGMAADRVHDGV